MLQSLLLVSLQIFGPSSRLCCSWAEVKHSLFARNLYFAFLFALKFFCLIFQRWYGFGCALMGAENPLSLVGPPEPQVSAGLPELQPVLFKFQGERKGKPGGSSNPLKWCFSLLLLLLL